MRLWRSLGRRWPYYQWWLATRSAAALVGWVLYIIFRGGQTHWGEYEIAIIEIRPSLLVTPAVFTGLILSWWISNDGTKTDRRVHLLWTDIVVLMTAWGIAWATRGEWGQYEQYIAQVRPILPTVAVVIWLAVVMRRAVGEMAVELFGASIRIRQLLDKEQRDLLKAARERIAELEARIAELEAAPSGEIDGADSVVTDSRPDLTGPDRSR